MRTLSFILTLLLLLSACSNTVIDTDSKRIHVTILHFNDIYEITSVGGGTQGGLARVATLRKQLLAKNPNTITVLGGDLFSPSAIGTASVNGKPLAGQQMVDVLNHLGLDYATFGNHEFDLKEPQFTQRMQEAKFKWVSSNVLNTQGQPYANVNQQQLLTFTGADSGKTFTLALFGVTLSENKPSYVSYTRPLTTASEQVKRLKDKTGFIVALSHQSIEDDVKMIEQNPLIDLVLGGHEHVNYQRWRGDFTPLLKADANVRSVYVVELFFDPATGKTEITPTLLPIDNRIAEDPELKKVVDKWVKIAFDAFRRQGFNPEEIVSTTTEALDGLESSIRSEQTNLSQLISRSMLLAYSTAELSILNSGSIRIDDILPAGKISQYDIIRILPFGGHVQLVEMSGTLLQKTLNQGLSNRGTGGFLDSANSQYSKEHGWLINNQKIKVDKYYKVAITDFLTSGKERNLGFLTPSNPALKIINTGQNNDIRKLVIQALKKPLII